MSLRRRISRSQYIRIRKCILNVSLCLIEEINDLYKDEVEEGTRKRMWTRQWIRRRNTRGASALLLKELSTEDPEEYRLCIRLTPKQLETLLTMVSPVIQRSDTQMRDAIPARTKLEITLHFLATGNSYRTIQHLFRVPKPTISKFIPEVCDAIFEALKDFVKVSINWF